MSPSDPSIEYGDEIVVDSYPLPKWWKRIFLVTLIFAPCYFLMYGIGAPGRSTLDLYASAAAANGKKQFGDAVLATDPQSLADYTINADWLAVGQSVFQTNCATCHGSEGGGIVGPNLTDVHYKHIESIDDIVTILNNGAANGAMPAWANRLSPNEIAVTSAYVAAMRGTNVASAQRGPEGVEIEPWPEPAPIAESDS